jgi:hypothetical protein
MSMREPKGQRVEQRRLDSVPAVQRLCMMLGLDVPSKVKAASKSSCWAAAWRKRRPAAWWGPSEVTENRVREVGRLEALHLVVGELELFGG